ncbi:MAG: DUF2163 domain-containing protein [Blastocatellia bacterium]|nr:DUF2163 domain-containing protein [Blastocatellia bacterium]
MREMLAGPLTSLAFCWRVERRDGAGFGMTSHDATLAIGGVDYSAEPGMLPAAIERGLGIKESDGETMARTFAVNPTCPAMIC